MKKLVIAALGILAASLLSSNAFAFTANHAKGIQIGESAVKVHHYWRHHRPLWDCCHHYRLCHYPYPRWYASDCNCSPLWPF